jgi:WD40 repeat protein
MKPLAEQKVELPHGPQDTLTSLRFSSRDMDGGTDKESDLLAVTSWDKTLRLYSTSDQPLMIHKEESQAALFDSSFSLDGHSVFFGGLDRQLWRYVLAFQAERGMIRTSRHYPLPLKDKFKGVSILHQNQ